MYASQDLHYGVATLIVPKLPEYFETELFLLVLFAILLCQYFLVTKPFRGLNQ